MQSSRNERYNRRERRGWRGRVSKTPLTTVEGRKLKKPQEGKKNGDAGVCFLSRQGDEKKIGGVKDIKMGGGEVCYRRTRKELGGT